MGFAERLSETRLARGLTQAELAARSGVSQSYLVQLEAGRYQPTLEILRNLAVVLAVSIDELAFDPQERELAPCDDLGRLIAKTTALDQRDRDTITNVIESLLYRHQAQASRAGKKKPGPAPRRN